MSIAGAEQFTDDEREMLGRYFTNLDGPVFALVNLPEVVKGALFARYSRSLEEPAPAVPRRVRRGARRRRGHEPRRLRRAATRRGALRPGLQRVRGRLGRPAGRRCISPASSRRTCSPRSSSGAGSCPTSSSRPATSPTTAACPPATTATTATPPCSNRRSAPATSARWTACSTPTASFCPRCRARSAREPAPRRHLRARPPPSRAGRCLDALRGLLPAGSLSNVGHLRLGPGLRAALLRMRAHPLPEARRYADLMLVELRKVIPSFLAPGRPARAGRGLDELPAGTPRGDGDRSPASCGRVEVPGSGHLGHPHRLRPRRRGQGARGDVLPLCQLCSEDESPGACRRARAGRTPRLIEAYVGERSNRRHRPGRALERTGYRFDIVADYGAFRDLQRHRMLTVEWQPLGTDLGFEVPEIVETAGLAGRLPSSRSSAPRACTTPSRLIFPSKAPTRWRSRSTSVSCCS